MSEVLWNLAPHTGAKHLILRKYLDAWFPILTKWNGRVTFIDGFAGPGEYVGGEPGSPAIVLDAAISHSHDLSRAELVFVFVESDGDRYEHLDDLLKQLRTPAHVRWQAIHGEFEDAIDEVLAKIGDTRMAPSFVMIDPFGVKGVAYSTIEMLAAHPKTEVLISFMYETVTRWIDSPDVEPHLDRIFGTPEWRHAKNLPTVLRKAFLLDLFLRQIRGAGFQHTLRFEMIDSGNRTEYFLIFGTHHSKGLEVMKDAMWKVDEAGRYQFSDATHPNQLTLFTKQPDYQQLREIILDRFKGQEASISEVTQFVLTETAFLPTHVRRNVLIPLEREGRLVASQRKRARTYPPGTRIRFPD